MLLKSGEGAIVNMASISGLCVSTLRVACGTSKAALMHLTRRQAAELGPLGIRVNAVAPGRRHFPARRRQTRRSCQPVSDPGPRSGATSTRSIPACAGIAQRATAVLNAGCRRPRSRTRSTAAATSCRRTAGSA
ncbi:MAG: SDR family oxidoreductase [Burkholderiales bacterium]|nr:SDR family oxidoreductase [Burkholderiales bacterium]